jgi:E3 ubiquitin-protein ligase UBR4
VIIDSRSINYDEKDPFLCNACGFCKYAKFEYTLSTRPCCAVDPIESEDDRKKAITNVNNLLEKADKVYNQLVGYKPAIESLLIRISESTADNVNEDAGSGGGGGGVNQLLVELAQRYCADCKNAFEELSKIIQRVMATRKELVSFDASRKSSAKASPATSPTEEPGAGDKKCVVATKCYGCASASVEHCLTLLRALAANPSSRVELFQQGLIEELMEFNLRRGSNSVRHEVRKLICLLTRDNVSATEHLNKLICDKIRLALIGRGNPDLVESARHEMSLLAVTISKEDSCWELRLRCVLQVLLIPV